MLIYDGVEPTTDYADNQVELAREVSRRGSVALYVDYDKGNETSMELLAEVSGPEDEPGSELWHVPAAAHPTTGVVSALPVHQFTAAGLYRITLPAFPDEDKVRFSLKRTGGSEINSSLVVQDLTYEADLAGPDGDDISITYVVAGLNTPLSVEVDDLAITVNLATDGAGAATSTADDIKAAVDLDAEAAELVDITVTGTGTNVQAAAAEAFLAGGAAPGLLTLRAI
jgi:hypothetical protein